MYPIYKIIALVYVLLNGQVMTNEPLRIPHRDTFNSFDACQTFLKSDEFGTHREALAHLVKEGVQFKLEQQAGEANQEDVPEVAVAITASCEEDHSL